MVQSHDKSAGIDERSVLAEIRVVRRRAERLLGQLRVERARAEQRWAESGRRDPISIVTGRSAIDNAVQVTERMLHSLDGYPDDGAARPPAGPARVPVSAAP